MSYVTNTLHIREYPPPPGYGVNNYCVLCRVKAKKQNNNIQQRTLTSFITIPSINYGQANHLVCAIGISIYYSNWPL